MFCQFQCQAGRTVLLHRHLPCGTWCYRQQCDEEITKCEKSDGPTAAAMLLITEYISSRKENWFNEFTTALVRSGHSHLAQLLVSDGVHEDC